MVLGVGYVSEHPDIEASIRRKGMYSIDGKEMLDAFEVAMSPQSPKPTVGDRIIVGLEPAQLAKSVKSTNADTFWLDEPRFRTIAAATNSYMGGKRAATGESICSVIEEVKSPEDAAKAVVAHLVQRLSRLLMIDAEDFQPDTKSIVSYGLDSMIGAEFRNWVFREFKIDIPFQQLPADNLTVRKFATDLCERLGKVAQ